MIGCVAKATTDEINTNQEEMEEVRWVLRTDVATAVAASARPDSPSPYNGARRLPAVSFRCHGVCCLIATCARKERLSLVQQACW